MALDRDTVLIADGVARSAGGRVGMKRGGVLTLAPEVEMYEHNPGREHAAQREVAVALMQFSPDVAVLEEAVVVVDIDASLRLFGGLLAVCQRAKAILEAIGLTARISAAPTGQGAWLLAKHRNRRVLKVDSLERQLSALPLLSVPKARPFADWFTGLGCETIADVRRLPHAGLQRRCGEHLLESLDRAFGTAPELSDWLELPPTFSARIEMPDRTEHAEAAVYEDGCVRHAQKVSTLDEALSRANRLKSMLEQRAVHPNVLDFCKSELLQENYFHAVFEAVKSVRKRLSQLSGGDDDSAELVDFALATASGRPRVAVTPLASKTDIGKQRGFANRLKGILGMVLNPLAHNAKIEWDMSEQDTLDTPTMLSLVHRKLDSARVLT